MAQEYFRQHDSFRSIDLDESPETIKSGSGDVFGWTLDNTHANKRYVKFYDSSSSPTVGTTAPKLTLVLGGNGSNVINIPGGIRFNNGIYIAVTTGLSDADVGAPGLNEVITNVFYK